MRWPGVISVVVLLCLIPATGQTAVPAYMSFQGILHDALGDPLNGVYSIHFSLYDDSMGGSELWSESRDSVAVVDGAFSVLLGQVNPLDSSIFIEDGVWLGIAVEGEEEMTPRQRIASSPYSFRASKADTADYALSAEVAPHTHDKFYLSNVGPDTMFAMSSQPTLTITNGGTGPALLAAGDIVSGFGIDIAGNAAIGGSLRVDQGISSSGDCVFESGSSIDFEDGAMVDFTGTTVTGLPSPPHSHDDLYISKDGPDTIRSFGTEATLTALNAATGRALSGINTYSGTNIGRGVYGEARSTTGRGVEGFVNSGTGENSGVYGRSNSSEGTGVLGLASSQSGSIFGVRGQAYSEAGTGVSGLATSLTGETHGVSGTVLSPQGTGVYGWAVSDSGTAAGIHGKADSPDGYGVLGENALGFAGYFMGDVHLTGDLTVDGTYPADPVVIQDSLYVNVSGPDSVTGGSGSSMLKVVNTGTGSAIEASADSGYAVYARSEAAQYSAYIDGKLFANRAVFTSSDTSGNGVYVQSAGVNAAYIDGNLFSTSVVIQDSAHVQGGLGVAGRFDASGDVDVAGSMSISGDITVPGPVNTDSLVVNGDVHIAGDLSVGGSYPGGTGGGPHHHDSLYVNAVGPDTMRSAGSVPTFHVSNTGVGEALVATSAGDTSARFMGSVGVYGQLVVGDTLTASSMINCNGLTANSAVRCDSLLVGSGMNLPAYTSYVSVGASEFVPTDNAYVFSVDGAELYADSASSDFYAPIQLPHGSTIKGVSFYWYDASVYQAFMTMKRATLDGSSDNTLATLSSTGSGGYGNTATAVPDETVNNAQYTYYLNLTLSNGSQGALLRIRGAVVEYEMSQPF